VTGVQTCALPIYNQHILIKAVCHRYYGIASD
jgi:hypothetical protein